MYLFVFNKESVSKNVFWPLLTLICISSSHHQHTSCSAVQLTAEQTAAADEKDTREATGGKPRPVATRNHKADSDSTSLTSLAIVSFNNLVAGRRSVVVSAATVFEEGTKFLSVVTQVQDHRPKDSQSRGARHNLQDTPEVLLCESVSGQ